MDRAFSFHFDLSCPYAYLASHAVEDLAARTGAALSVRPFLLGGVFRARGVAQNLAGTLSPAKAAHNLADMQRGAEALGVPLVMPPGHPIRTVKALRVLLVHNREMAAGDAHAEAHGRAMLPLLHALYRAYWADGVDISTDAGLAEVIRGVGLDSERLLAGAEEPWVKDELRRRTDEAIELGVFGAPAFVVEGTGPWGEDAHDRHLFWGHDRLPYVEAALGGDVAELAPAHEGPPVEVWFDYSSPFAYLGVSRARRVLGPRVRWRPMLLGALFKAIEGPMVPLQTFSAAKQAWVAKDLAWQAREAGVPVSWPSRFPVRTVLPLRVTLLVLEDATMADRADALIARLFRAVWVEDLDPADPATIAACCDEVGLPGADLVARSREAKAALFTATETAHARGAFGAPTFVVDPEGDASLYWGNDRLPLVARATDGVTV